MVTKSRGEIVMPTESVQLVAQFRNENDIPTDLDSFPFLTIIQPTGNVFLGPTSAGVYRLDVGKYAYTLKLPVMTDLGVWADLWEGALGGFVVNGTFNFIVMNTDIPMVNTDGYVALGDDVGFNYSQNELRNINKVLKVMKARLNSAGKARSFDAFGNPIFVDCDIFTIEQLATMACASLEMFNAIPHFTSFDWNSTSIIDNFLWIIAQGGVLIALSSQALIERGKEFALNDNSISFTPPTVSEILNTQFGTELANHTEMVKQIKASMKPSPLGLGTLRILGATGMLRLRHLRERRLI